MSWSNSVAITIDHTKVPSTQTNFPVLVAGVYSQLATTSNGGSVTSANGWDIIFASDSLGASPLSFERVAWSSRTGACEFWVNIPSLSSSTNTTIYILFGNSAISTDQQNAAAVWDSNYKLVEHFGSPGIPALTAFDSTTNANTGSVTGAPVVVAGQWGGAASLNGSQYVTFNSSASLNIVGAVTMEAWVYPTTSGVYQAIINRTNAGNVRFYACFLQAGSTSQVFLAFGGTNVGTVSLSASWTVNAWNHICNTADGTNAKTYLNGVLVNTTSSSLDGASATSNVYLGYDQPVSTNGLVGNLDECRVSSTIRSADWIKTCYNNQSSPSTFYSTTLTTGSGGFGPYVTAENIGTPIAGHLAGTFHQKVKPSAAVTSVPSYFNPVPLAAVLQQASAGVAYSETISAQGGTSPYTYAVTGGTLPSGISLTGSTGVLSGTASTLGTSTFTITVTDTNGFTGSTSFSITVVGGSGAVKPVPYDAAIPSGFLGTTYSTLFLTLGGTPSYAYAVLSGSLPPGLSLNSTGGVTGIPTASGTYNFAVRATDSLAVSGGNNFTMTVQQRTVVPVAELIHDGQLGVSYSEQMFGDGGIPPYAFAVASGALPAGLMMTSGGLISGVPSASGVASFGVSATDAFGSSGAFGFEINVTGSPTIVAFGEDLQYAILNDFYDEPLEVAGGTPPYTFALVGGALPTGLTLAASGVISGTPTVVEAESFTVQVTDANGLVGDSVLRLSVQGPLLPTIVPTVTLLPYGVVGTAYSETITAQGGTPPYSYGVNSGALPDGLTLGTGGPGVISGTPTTAGTFNFQIIVFDADTFSGLQDFTIIIVDAGSQQVVPYASNLQTAFIGTPYSEFISATGGTPSYTFAAASGSLPVGMVLNSSTGEIHGEPLYTGAFSFTVTATDSLGDVGTTAFTIMVDTAPGTTTVTPVGSVLHDALAGASYSEAMSAAGGTAPYSFTITAGGLPTGLSMNGDGVISGTPTELGLFEFVVQVRDTHGVTGSLEFGINVNAASGGGNSGYAG